MVWSEVGNLNSSPRKLRRKKDRELRLPGIIDDEAELLAGEGLAVSGQILPAKVHHLLPIPHGHVASDEAFV